MTVASQVKQCVASLKNVEASLNSFAIDTKDEQASEIFRESCQITRQVITDLEKRVGELEFQEPQYKGF
ncbi:MULTISPECIES: DUF1657 domain-containing protein [Bacillaceae]|uniref:DUF1657 domain-containing protein n=1 Tax=Evansella alkalicola TaxID=745819 RepID=A0ABS6JWG9_9BACI|nr:MULTISPECIES: DUF1657 domain-containing protein [Bacillaceae]MBU9722916.1 DUF1657 domain-containing protein [Bacillus alkalicola]